MKLKKLLCILISTLMITSASLITSQAADEETHTHYGGHATCINYAICIVCNESYGELVPHTDYDEDNICDVCSKILVEPEVTEKTETGICGKSSHYTLNRQTGELVISGTGSVMDNTFSGREDIKSVIIENEIEALHPFAFSKCKNLESVRIGDGIRSISRNAFSECESLKSVIFPSGLKSISENAFSLCNSLEEIELPENLKEIHNEAFSNSGLRRIVLPQSLEDFCCTAFNYCKDLVSVSFSGSTAISEGYGGLFTGCSALEEVIVPQENRYLTFENGILFNKDKSEIIRYLCGNKNESYVLPDTVTNIYQMAFEEQTHLKEITIPDTMSEIPECAFYECYSLETVNLPDNLEKISYEAFNYCISLKNIIIPESVRSIGGYAFHSCYSLEKIIIPENVKEIADGAFNDCVSLKEITLPEALGNLECTFSNCSSLEAVNIPACGFSNTDDSVFSHCTNLKTINLSEGCDSLKVNKDGVLLSRDETKLICYPGGKQDKSYTVPSTVTMINQSAFADNKYIEEIIVPDSVIYIDTNAFGDCSSLKAVELSSNLKEISAYLFSRDTNLKEVCIPEGVVKVKGEAFEYCVSLESITIPSTAEQIDPWAFSDCFNLRTIINKSETASQYDKKKLADSYDYRSFKPWKPMTGEEVAAFFDAVIKVSDSLYYIRMDDLDAYIEMILENNEEAWGDYYLEFYEKMFRMEFDTFDEALIWMDSIYEKAFSQELPDNTTVFCSPTSKEHEVCKEEGINHRFIDGACDFECGIHSNVVSSGYYAPTCTENGYNGGKVCMTCLDNAQTDAEEAAAIIEEPVVIPATGHKVVTIKEVKATCTENGLTEGAYCEKCYEVFTEQTVIPATGHIDNDSDGVCDVCGHLMNEETEEKPVTVFTRFINFVRNAFDRILKLFKKVFG